MDILLVGRGGCMRELAWQILEDNRNGHRWNIVGYVDNTPPASGESTEVNGFHIPYFGGDDDLLSSVCDRNVILSLGSSRLRAKLAERFRQNPHLHFPNIVLRSASVCDDVRMGQGCIITMDARVSTNVLLGDFVFLNTGSMVCHDGVIGSFVTINPRVQLAGAVAVGECAEIGMGATIIQGRRVGRDAVIGAGAVVIRDVEAGVTMVGVPARKVMY